MGFAAQMRLVIEGSKVRLAGATWPLRRRRLRIEKIMVTLVELVDCCDDCSKHNVVSSDNNKCFFIKCERQSIGSSNDMLKHVCRLSKIPMTPFHIKASLNASIRQLSKKDTSWTKI